MFHDCIEVFIRLLSTLYVVREYLATRVSVLGGKKKKKVKFRKIILVSILLHCQLSCTICKWQVAPHSNVLETSFRLCAPQVSLVSLRKSGLYRC